MQRFTELEYLVIGLVSTMPAFVIPLFLVGKVIWQLVPSTSEDLLDVILHASEGSYKIFLAKGVMIG